MVHFGAKVTNVVHRHWFSRGYSENTDLRLDQIFVVISGVQPVKPPALPLSNSH